MASQGSQILAADFVAIQDKAESLLGPGSATRGYGQTVQSSDVFIGNQITKDQWDALRYDIINIRYHQDGVVPNIVQVNRGDVIGYGASNANNNYDTLLEQAITNRFQVATSQSIITARGNVSYSSSWSSTASFELIVTFGTSDQARYFFNSGGKIRLASTLTGGSSPQDNSWSSLLTSIGTRSFGAATDPLINYYTLTNSYQTYFQQSASTPYNASSYRLEARTNVANNSTGTATTLFLRVTLLDSYTDAYPAIPPADIVTGTLTINVEELKAAGTMQPSGTFSIISPSYSLSSIVAS